MNYLNFSDLTGVKPKASEVQSVVVKANQRWPFVLEVQEEPQLSREVVEVQKEEQAPSPFLSQRS